VLTPSLTYTNGEGIVILFVLPFTGSLRQPMHYQKHPVTLNLILSFVIVNFLVFWYLPVGHCKKISS
jgi:hypothetical protein